MQRIILLTPALAMLLTGCGAARVETAPAPTPVAAATAQPPIDLLGTWTDPAGGGFIAFGTRQIVIAVDGAPRSVTTLRENAIEPGMSAGKLALSDGTDLFLSRGTSQRDGILVDHIDVEVVHGGSPVVRRRLLSEAGLRQLARVVVREPAVTPPPTPDMAFLAAVPASRAAVARELVESAAAGAPRSELAARCAEAQRRTLGAVLSLIERSLSERSPETLREADRLRGEADAFSIAWRSWLAGRG